MAARNLNVAFLFCAIVNQAIAISRSNFSLTSSSKAQAERGYTQNSLCRENNCINPLLPGLNDLPRLEGLAWQCASTALVSNYMGFCKDAVLYDPALPSPSSAKSVVDLVKAQDDAAMTMFVYHLNGMGYDAWDYREPSQSDNDCVRSVWKMVCYTYFPRANAGCKSGEMSVYQRPCGSSCHNYLSHCGVECCDESVQCSFTHTKTEKDGKVTVLQTGYAEENGPSATCTGAARRSVSAPFFLLLAIFGIHCASSSPDTSAQAEHSPKWSSGLHLSRQLPLLVFFVGLCLVLQGCDSGIAMHTVGNWRAKPSYLSEYQFLPAGANPRSAILNSCSQKDIKPSLQCSGRGYCEAFTTNAIVAQERDQSVLAFCRCEPGYADPECGTERKSQTKAFALSVCFGMFGADYFYLGYPLWGAGKLVTLGGLGFWWLVDIVRIGSGPVYANQFRVANDLSHWVAILFLVFLCSALGFVISIESYLSYRKTRRDDMAKQQHTEEANAFQNTKQAMMGGYGAAAAPRGGFEAAYGGGGGSPPMPMVSFAGRQ